MKNKRTLKQSLGLTLRGMAMGAADVIPGVSGGTIAFITGIYEELITSISNVNLEALRVLRKEGIKSFWNHVNGNFFVALLSGIAISILSLARVVTFLLDEYPVLLWAFFFGLVIASSQLVLKTVKEWNIKTIAVLLLGIGIAAYVSLTQVTASGGDLFYIFISGAIAICAMILPGISGAFILVLMGSYTIVIEGLKNMDRVLIIVFMAGCLVGILSFSRLLKYLFAKHKSIVLALLSGFLIGSLIKVWPWQNPIGDAPLVVHSNGKEDWMMVNVLPQNFQVNGELADPQMLFAVLLALTGYLLIIIMDRFSPKKAEDNE